MGRKEGGAVKGEYIIMSTIKVKSVNIYQVLAMCREVCWVVYIDSHLFACFGGQNRFTGGEAVPRRGGTLSKST